MSTVTLGELCSFVNGGAWSDSDYCHTGIPVLKVSNCKNSGFSLSEISYLSHDLREKYKQNKLQIDDIIIATVGSHPQMVESAAGRSCIVTHEVVGYYLNQNAVCIRTVNPSVLDQKYLFYLSKTKKFMHYIQNRGKGAANQIRIAIGAIKDYTLELPRIVEQRRIVAILSAYDDLIENNQKQIKLLEEAAQRLYKEWFVDLRFPGWENTKIVDGVPEGWERATVGSLLRKISRTKQILACDYQIDGTIPIIDQSRDFIAGYTNNTEARIELNEPIIVFGDHTRILKYITFPFAKGADGTQLIISSSDRMPQSLFYFSLIHVDLSNYHYARHFKYLKESVVLVPTRIIAQSFDSIVQSIMSRIQVLRDNSFKASKVRNQLIPKLMSKETEV